MPKVILEFDSLEERQEMEDAINGWRYSLALHNIKQKIRQIWKYQDLPDDVYKKVDEIYEMVCNEVADSRMED